MRDPDLIVRAQQAAEALERAWRHWRNVHGLDADPLPPVSSYVGYSLDAPWGEARVVLGVCAAEAEQLTALLEGHDCVGPVHASVTARPVGRTQSAGISDVFGWPGAAGRVHVPAPAPASAGQQPLSARSSLSGQDPLAGPRRRDSSRPSELTRPSVAGSASLETPIALAASRAVEASVASRKKAASTSPAPLAEKAAKSATTSGPDGPRGNDRAGLIPRPALDPAGESQRRAEDSQRRAETQRTPSHRGETSRAASCAGSEAAESQPSKLTDGATVTSAGGLPPMPAVQPFPWAASQLQVDAERQPAGERAGDGGGSPAAPGIVPFRPRPETFSPPASRQQPESFPAQRDELPTQHIDSELARSSRVMRGPSWSALKRHGQAQVQAQGQGQGADHPQAPPQDQRPAPQAPAGPGWPQDGRDRIGGSAAASADAATWAAGERPGQAAVTDTAV